MNWVRSLFRTWMIMYSTRKMRERPWRMKMMILDKTWKNFALQSSTRMGGVKSISRRCARYDRRCHKEHNETSERDENQIKYNGGVLRECYGGGILVVILYACITAYLLLSKLGSLFLVRVLLNTLIPFYDSLRLYSGVPMWASINNSAFADPPYSLAMTHWNTKSILGSNLSIPLAASDRENASTLILDTDRKFLSNTVSFQKQKALSASKDDTGFL